jgi:CubicO group peptidase (beta-lactamase class C family)
LGYPDGVPAPWIISVAATLLAAAATVTAPAATHAAAPWDSAGPSNGIRHERHCAVTAGRDPARATPGQVGMDPAALDRAIAFGQSRFRLNIQIYRHNCLVAEGPLNRWTDRVAWNSWSIAKTATSLVAGVAIDQGKLDPNAPIGRYLPAGLGDAAHRAITVLDLLTETSGLRQAVGAEGLTAVIPVDPDSPVQALGLPIDNPPGRVFAYSQRTVDLLVYVIERAVRQDFRDFAQRVLFDPLGIPAPDFYWARDRSGNTHGYTNLIIPPDDQAKLGLLLANYGDWAGRRIVSRRYLRQATSPSKVNPCYGYLIWVAGPTCDDPTSGLLPGSFATSGMLNQNMFITPKLDLMVSWTGLGGSVSPRGLVGLMASTGELAHEFARLVYAAVADTGVPDPGPHIESSVVLPPSYFVTPDVLAATVGLGPDAYPGCTVLGCGPARLALPYADTPPGCLVFVCLGTDPRTPGIR